MNMEQYIYIEQSTKEQQSTDVMGTELTHTKIYGHGAIDVLKQADVNAKFEQGDLKIILSKTSVLVIVAEGNKLRFYIESLVPVL